MRSLRQAHVPPPVTPGAPTERLLGDLWQDLRYAARMLRKQPGFAITAILTLGLGIGANTAIISLVRALFFSPLAVEDASRLVNLHQTLAHRRELLAFEIALPDYWYYRDQTRAPRADGSPLVPDEPAAARRDRC